MPGRNLVVLFDGTWNKAESGTNVERLTRLIAAADAQGAPQLSRYIVGVGVKPGLTRLLGGAFGWGLSDHVQAGYRWLCEQWQPGDAAYLFGFSRGAYTARSLGGLIRKCGLLKAGADRRLDAKQVETAYDFYRTADIHPDDPRAVAFRAQHSLEIGIRMIGVWDTVGSLGIPDVASWFPGARARYSFHDTELSKIVQYAYHAMALNERRADYAPTKWTRKGTAGEAVVEKKPEQAEVEQRWFIGAHADVGGGYRKDGAGRRPDLLPDLALAWLQRMAMHAGLAFDAPFVPAADADSAMPNDSYREFMYGLYRALKPPFDRTVGGGVNETVDESVWQRWRGDAGYRPPALAEAVIRGSIAVPPDIRS